MNCPKFVSESFALRTAIHLAHLTTRSYSQHMALGDFYEALTDLVDKYAEIYLGQEKQVADFPSVRPPAGAPVLLIETYLRMVKAELAEDSESEALINILAEIEALASQTLYKLRNLK